MKSQQLTFVYNHENKCLWHIKIKLQKHGKVFNSIIYELYVKYKQLFDNINKLFTNIKFEL